MAIAVHSADHMRDVVGEVLDRLGACGDCADTDTAGHHQACTNQACLKQGVDPLIFASQARRKQLSRRSMRVARRRLGHSRQRQNDNDRTTQTRGQPAPGQSPQD